MKRIVLCFDGTWNRPADDNIPEDQQVETNVRRFYESVKPLADDGVEQFAWYDQGIGTHWYDKFIGGTFGAGLDLNILEGYKVLAKNYKDGDEVFVLGFSRGAYTARSLVGLIRNCGLVKNRLLPLRTAMAYGIYRTRDDGPDSMVASEFREVFSREIKIKFLGVWDTVGALGIPFGVLKKFNSKLYEFHDTSLSGIVENGYHAVAIDENRRDYDVCLWNPKEKPNQTLEQRWFVGAHSDVGGGYEDRRLSDLTLRWMQEKASEQGLDLKLVKPTDENYRAPYRDSYTEFLKGEYGKLFPRYFRSLRTTSFGNELIDETVKKRRQDDPGYKPGNQGFD